MERTITILALARLLRTTTAKIRDKVLSGEIPVVCTDPWRFDEYAVRRALKVAAERDLERLAEEKKRKAKEK